MQNLFVECTDPDRVLEAVLSYRRAIEGGEGWDLMPHYPTRLKISPCRESLKASTNFPRHVPWSLSLEANRYDWHWIQIVAEKDVTDLALARWLSKALGTCVVAVFCHEAADSYGTRIYRNGDLRSADSHEMEERAHYRAEQELAMLRIPYHMVRYADCGGPGWRMVEMDPT